MYGLRDIPHTSYKTNNLHKVYDAFSEDVAEKLR